MKDNFNISDFELSESEMQKIYKLEQSRRFLNMTLEE
jgi:Aldo/keto reductases, related to diketogulonate reductase